MDAITTLIGSVPFVAQKQDGTTEDVQIHTIKLKDFRRLAIVIGDYHAMAEVFCNRPRGWGETLTDESIDAIITEGKGKMNVDFFVRWCRDQAEFIAAVNPAAVAPAGPSTSGLPTSPRSPG